MVKKKKKRLAVDVAQEIQREKKRTQRSKHGIRSVVPKHVEHDVQQVYQDEDARDGGVDAWFEQLHAHAPKMRGQGARGQHRVVTEYP